MTFPPSVPLLFFPTIDNNTNLQHMHINDFITTAPISCQCPHQTMVNETAWLARHVILFWTCHCHLTVHTSSVYNSLHKACELNSSPQNNSPIFHYKNHQEVAKDNLYNYLRDYVGGSRMFVSCKWVVIVTHVLPSAQNNGISWPFQRSHGNKKKIVGPVGKRGSAILHRPHLEVIEFDFH